MKLKLLATHACATLALPAMASDVTYRKDVQPFIKAKCAECHGSDSPSLQDFKLDEEKYKKAKRTLSATEGYDAWTKAEQSMMAAAPPRVAVHFTKAVMGVFQ